MKKNIKNIPLILFILSCIATSAQAVTLTNSNYYVRPALRIGAGEIIDGYKYNSSLTSSLSQWASGYSTATVNLKDGTVKGYMEGVGTTQGLQIFGGMGERITAIGGAGTNVTIDFTLEGSVFANVNEPVAGNNPATFYYDIGIVAFQTGVANYNTFFGLANDPCYGQDPLNCNPAPAPLAFNYSGYRVSHIIDQDNGEFYYEIDDTRSATLSLNSNREEFDIFIFTNLLMSNSPQSGILDFEVDFLHTGTAGLNFAPGVVGYSSSGQFLSLSAPPPPNTAVPEPASMILLGLGSLGFGFMRKKTGKA